MTNLPSDYTMRKIHLAYYQMIASDNQWQDEIIATWGIEKARDARYDNRGRNTNRLELLHDKKENDRRAYVRIIEDSKQI